MAFALNQWRTIPFGRTLAPLKTTSVNRKGFPENSREENLIYDPLETLLANVENFLDNVENFFDNVEKWKTFVEKWKTTT